MEQPRLLIVDDESASRDGLQMALEPSGYTCVTAKSGTEALRILEETRIDVMITDIRMPGIDGLELFQKARILRPMMSVILVTAYGEVGTAVNVMKEGAFDYITKPVNLEEIELSVVRAIASAQLKEENENLRQQLMTRSDSSDMIGRSQAMRRVYEMVQAVGPTRATVLLEGETGTGKELLAKALHEASPRKNDPFVAVNCAALPETLLETELFGHVKGAFTGADSSRMGRFERADQGTLFLDEITEAPLATQVKLLRVLQDQTFEKVGGNETLKVDVRIIAASNVDIRQSVASKTFREDLYYRLNVITIRLPRLNERREDIPLLVAHFLAELAEEHSLALKEISHGTMEILQSYSWPGNVRQLRNCIETMLVLSRSDILTESEIPPEILTEVRGILPSAAPLTTLPDVWEGLTLKELETQAITRALKKAGGNKTLAAQSLDVSRSTLYRKMERLGIGEIGYDTAPIDGQMDTGGEQR